MKSPRCCLSAGHALSSSPYSGRYLTGASFFFFFFFCPGSFEATSKTSWLVFRTESTALTPLGLEAQRHTILRTVLSHTQPQGARCDTSQCGGKRIHTGEGSRGESCPLPSRRTFSPLIPMALETNDLHTPLSDPDLRQPQTWLSAAHQASLLTRSIDTVWPEQKP